MTHTLAENVDLASFSSNEWVDMPIFTVVMFRVGLEYLSYVVNRSRLRMSIHVSFQIG